MLKIKELLLRFDEYRKNWEFIKAGNGQGIYSESTLASVKKKVDSMKDKLAKIGKDGVVTKVMMGEKAMRIVGKGKFEVFETHAFTYYHTHDDQELDYLIKRDFEGLSLNDDKIRITKYFTGQVLYL